TADAILEATSELLHEMIVRNAIIEDDLASLLFTTTPDLNAVYPAKAARQMGWTRVALMGFQEMNVPGGLSLCIRVLMHWHTDKSLDEIEHVFMRDAIKLRPDLAKSPVNKN
ncbi:MAG: chorismate mutase, partial [Aggregatilineales bacterium]